MFKRTSIAAALAVTCLGSPAALAQRQESTGPGAAIARSNPDICGFRACNSEAAMEPFTETIRNRRFVESRPLRVSASEIVAGKEVRDSEVALIGTIASVDASLAMVRYGGREIGVPLSAFWKLDGHLVLPVTRREFNRVAALHVARTENEATDDQAE